MDFPDLGVYTGSQADGVWIVRLPEAKLVALHAFCTHDGCSTSWMQTENQFKCACCGSEFKMDGTNSRGPANRPLERCKIYLHRESVMVNRSATLRHTLEESKLSEASILMNDK